MNVEKYFNFTNLIFFSLIFYSQIYSPILSDDWLLSQNINYFIPERPLSFFIIRAYKFINQNYFIDLFKIFKIFIIFLNYYFLYKFLSFFFEKNISQIFSFIAIFYPLHDSANYQVWFIIHQFCMILPLYSYYLISIRKIKLACIIFLFIPFLSYAALPTQIAIIYKNIKDRKYNITIFFISFLILYVIYYLFITLYLDIGTKRIGVGVNEIELVISNIISLKNFAIHFISFIDILVGPSHIIKIIYLVINNSILTFSFSLILAYFFSKKLYFIKKTKMNLYFDILMIIIVSLIFSQVLYIISTKFISIPFNLGNRVNIYLSLFISLILLWIIKKVNVKFTFAILFIFFLTFFGANNYWKKVNLENILLSYEIKKIAEENKNKNIFLKNVEYVKLYNFKHIELTNLQYYLDYFIIYNEVDTVDNNFKTFKGY